VKVVVRCFASVRELIGEDELTIDLPAGATITDLEKLLVERAPDFARLPVAYAVNRCYATRDAVLSDGDEVAFIPPISGGVSEPERFRFDLIDGVLEPRQLEQEARSDRDGAIVTFAGVTRDHNDGQSVVGLRYEAYGPMAAAIAADLFERAAQRYAIGRARIAHRLGEVPIGEASVIVVVAAPHRDAAFGACRFLMDRVKAEVPIFKQEHLAGPGGGERWVGELPELPPRE